jgi:urea transporter
MPAPSSLARDAEAWLRALLRGCAQVAFCDSSPAGVLVLAGVTLASPYSGFGMFVGAVFGTVAGRFVRAYRREEWAWGLAGFNPAIIGLLWCGFFASGEIHPAWLVPILTLGMALDVVLRKPLARLRLPALSAGALVTVYLVSLVAAPHGSWFWTTVPASAFIPLGLLGAACVVVATALKSPFASLWALSISTMTFLASWLSGYDPRDLVGLWGITVPLASFGVHAVFMRGSLAGAIAGTVAALAGAALWFAWEVSPLGRWLPPLLTPFILGVWLAMSVIRKLTAVPLATPEFWRVVRAVVAARAQHCDVVALIPLANGNAATDSGFIGGSWLDPQVPRSAFEREFLHASAQSRQEFWEAAQRLKDEAKRLPPCTLPARVARLQRAGWLQSVIIQDVRLPVETHEVTAVVPVHGDIERAQCLDCGVGGPWPPRAVRRRCDVRCAACQGAVVPAITPFGGAIDDATASRLRELAVRSALILVLGDEASEPATLAWLDQMRGAGTTIAFVSDGAAVYPRRAADISVPVSAKRFLAFLMPVLAGYRAVAAGRGHRDRHAAAAIAAGREQREAPR